MHSRSCGLGVDGFKRCILSMKYLYTEEGKRPEELKGEKFCGNVIRSIEVTIFRQRSQILLPVLTNHGGTTFKYENVHRFGIDERICTTN